MTDALPTARTLLEEGITEGLHPGAQLYVSLSGEPVADLALGEARPGVPLASDGLLPWLSATKPLAALAFGQLWERGALGLDDPVARFLPDFARHGKEGVTLRHVLTHTGGFRMLEVGFPRLPWAEIVERVCAARREPRWIPGRRAGYHQAGSWFALAEVLRRVDGRAFERYVREEILLPLAMEDSWVGMPAARFTAYGDRIAISWDTEREPPQAHPWHEEAWATSCSPPGGGRGPLRELARLYEMLLGGGALAGARLLEPPTVEALLARHRGPMFDRTFHRPMDWGLGFIPNSETSAEAHLPYHYGRHAGPRAVGHSGYRSVVAFVDRGHSLVVALGVTGTPSDAAHQARFEAVLEAVYEDLELAVEEAE